MGARGLMGILTCGVGCKSELGPVVASASGVGAGEGLGSWRWDCFLACAC